MIVGVLGAGRAGIRHINNARALGYTAVWYDPNPDLITDEDATGRYSFRDELIDAADVLVSATPTSQHYEDLCDAIDARKPILVEKPIASLGLANAVRDALEDAADKGVAIATGFNLRFHPLVRTLEQVPDPFFVSLICSQYTTTPADGVINHWASHEIDLAHYLIGPCHLLDTHKNGESIDLYLTNWHENVQAAVHSDMIAKKRFRQAIVIGHQNSIAVDLEKIPVSNDDYKAMLHSFVKEAQTGNSDLRIATGWDGLLVLDICERATALNVQRDQ